MRSVIVQWAGVAIAVAVLLIGTRALVAQRACVNFNQACVGWDCYKVGNAKCTDDTGTQRDWNRLTQNNGVGYLLGQCHEGNGNCIMKQFPCNADKYWNDNPNDATCNATTFRCTDPFNLTGCKDS
ncbi:MAG: hypothetical protein KatS3mg108_0184 [Isosphaeraceae bacterium]|jgi:hypothetical protein|nr:MAG: hypothetical protein KatS3mg108_0184 [Isosphaeraceae bacterium]